MKGVATETSEVLISSLEKSTLNQYNSTLKMWWSFCIQRSEDPYRVSIDKVLKFLTKRFKDGARHGTLNSARAALSLISMEDLANNQLLSRFIKGAFKQRPSRPRYDRTWDVEPVLKRLGEWDPVESLDIRTLTKKLVVLLALGTGQRIQTLSLIKISNIKETEQGFEIRITDRIKTTRVGSKQPVLRLPNFLSNPKICIAKTLRQYLQMTSPLRNGEDSLFLTLNKPHSKVNRDTIARWIKTSLTELGVPKEFTAHSTRHASTSRADTRGVNINEIRRVAGWTNSSRVFADFYKRDIIENSNNFAEAVLLP